VYPAELYAWARTQVPSEAEAVLSSGNGFRAIGVIETLEEDLGPTRWHFGTRCAKPACVHL